MAAFSDLSTLPVSLTQFNAIISGSQAQLSWSTASEQNNKGFHIQRSANGRDYANIGFVTASGNGSGANYSYTDAVPLNGRNFYRLQQVDVDGKTSLSQVRELSFMAANLRIYPNPVKTTLTLTVPAANEPLQLRLTDLRGSVLKSWNYRQTPPTLQLGVEQLPAGIYLLEVWQGLQEKQVIQVIKQ